MLQDKKENIVAWKGEEKTVKLKIRNMEDLIQKAKHLLQSCSKKEPRENVGEKAIFLKHKEWDFLGGTVVKTLPCNVRDAGSISGLGTKTPHVLGQLSPKYSCALGLA